jgi:AcrR family transcriptional regulator
VPVNAARRAPPGLSRERILEAATEELDAHGLPGFSMRGLAAALGVSAPSLYWHFHSRDDLLAALVDHAFAQIDLERTAGDWHDEVTWLAGQAWSVGRAHPGLLALLPTAPAYPASAQRLVRGILLALRRGGFGAHEAVAHTRTLVWTTFGFMRAADRGVLGRPLTRVTAGRASVRTPVYLDLEGLATDDVTLLAECLPALSEIDVDQLFARTLHLLLSAMTPGPGSPKTRARRRSR